MATATSAQSDDALRNERSRPSLSSARIGGFNHFVHVSEPDLVLGQAYALLILLSGTFRDNDAIGDSGIEVGPDKLLYMRSLQELRPDLIAEALDGVSSLLGLVQHGIELMRDGRG